MRPGHYMGTQAVPVQQGPLLELQGNVGPPGPHVYLPCACAWTGPWQTTTKEERLIRTVLEFVHSLVSVKATGTLAVF